LKTTIIIVACLATGLGSFGQNAPSSVDANKELVIATAGGTNMDPGVAPAAPLTAKAEPVRSSSLLTLHPMAIPFVKDYLEEHQERLLRMRSSALPYFTLIDNILGKHNLPRELKYLAVIESDLKSTATSWAGAAGPWQFMPETGRLMGLTVTPYRDDRRDLYRSTHAAAKYLRLLYSELNDWLLVIAAYNGGSARVESAIKKSGSRNFWDLQYYLPAESRNHVKKFIATHYIMEGQGGITTTVRADAKRSATPPVSQEILDSCLLRTVSGKYSSLIIAQTLDMDPLLFQQLNPGFDAKVSTDGYGMRLPGDKMGLFEEKKMEILDGSVNYLLSGAVPEKFPQAVKLPKKK